MKAGIKFSVLASGSRGNACYVETDEARVLLDAGLSCRELVRRFDMLGIRPDALDAVIVTHEHQDHIKGAGPFSRRFDLPVYLNQRTYERSLKALGNLTAPLFVRTGQTLTIKDLRIETFTKCHDATDPLGVVFSSNGTKLGLITDLGRTTHLVEDKLKGCQGLILEFNYDPGMLAEGPYPLYLKRRIAGAEGHLSNAQAADLLKAVFNADLETVVLAHLSETNNNPSKAYEAASGCLRKNGFRGPDVVVSMQDEPLPVACL